MLERIRTILWKLFVGPFRYGRGDSFDAKQYWDDRFARHGRRAIQSVGDESKSVAENDEAYAKARVVFEQACEKAGVVFAGASVCEVGVGTGFYTTVLHEAGVRQYVGVDITDRFFGELRERFSDARFESLDITCDVLEGAYDVVCMIDVLEHITSKRRLSAALHNLARAAKKDGHLVLGPVMRTSGSKLFYVHSWNREDVMSRLGGFEEVEVAAFREGDLYVLKKNS